MRLIPGLAFACGILGCSPPGLTTACTDGCLDECGNRFFGGVNQSCAADYLSDYNRGYALGYQDGLLGQLTDGVNSQGFVDGYWDGLADGRAAAY